MKKNINRLGLLAAASLIFVLSACGGGATSPTPAVSSPATKPTIPSPAATVATPAQPPINSPAATTPPPTGASATQTPGGMPALTPTGPVTPAIELATAGRMVFTGRCQSCHGAQGQGGPAPAVIGAGINLVKYGTAGGLHRYISTAMPPTAPGSLAAPDYLNVTGYLLVQNNFVLGETQIAVNQMDNIKLQ